MLPDTVQVTSAESSSLRSARSLTPDNLMVERFSNLVNSAEKLAQSSTPAFQKASPEKLDPNDRGLAQRILNDVKGLEGTLEGVNRVSLKNEKMIGVQLQDNVGLASTFLHYKMTLSTNFVANVYCSRSAETFSEEIQSVVGRRN